MIKHLLVLVMGVGIGLPVLAGGPPPTVDDLDGAVFLLTAQGTAYDLAGERSKYGTEVQTTITKTGPDTVSLSGVLGGMIITAYYKDGFLLQAVSSGESPPDSGSAMYLQASGSPGKLKLKGAYTTYAAGAGFNVLRVLRLKGKQTP